MTTRTYSGEAERGKVRGPYKQESVKKRIEALFRDNVGKVLTREQILIAARDPKTGIDPENWHQRLSELPIPGTPTTGARSVGAIRL
jgi:hypothetical protein